MADRFRLEGRHFRLAQPRKGLKIARAQRRYQRLRDLDDVGLHRGT